MTNGEGATVSGYELSFQLPLSAVFDDLPVVLDGMGFIANYTYVDSEKEYTFNGNDLIEKFDGMSNNQYNFTVYYEQDAFSARVSLAERSEYIANSNADRNDNLYQIVKPYFQADFSSSYEVNDNLTLSLEVLNLTDENVYGIVDEPTQRLDFYDSYGRNILLGARYKF